MGNELKLNFYWNLKFGRYVVFKIPNIVGCVHETIALLGGEWN